MNKQRREALKKVVGILETAYAELDGLKEEEQEAFDNLSEGLQQSERGQQWENNVSQMQEALDNIESAKDSTQHAIDCCDGVE